jgi:penicillin-binding protein 1A
VAGKTGTTQSNADGWFIAVMPKLVVGSWVGADDPRVHFRLTSLGQGASTALPIVGKMLRETQNDPKTRSALAGQFPDLPGSLRRKIDCPLYKSDTNIFERIFGKPEKDNRRAFGEPEKKKKGFLKKLFGNR